MNSSISERIKQKRIAVGMTQKELAQKIGVPYQTLQFWENGKRKPKIENILKISDALGISVGEIYGIDEGKGDPNQINRLYLKISEVAEKYGRSEEEIVDWINKCLAFPHGDMSEAVANRLDFLSEDMAKNVYENISSLDASEQLEIEELVDTFEHFSKEGRRYVLDVMGMMLLLNDTGLK